MYNDCIRYEVAFKLWISQIMNLLLFHLSLELLEDSEEYFSLKYAFLNKRVENKLQIERR